MLEINREIHEYTGVSKFHMAGYTGKRTAAATGEFISPEDCNCTGRVETLVDVEQTNAHSQMTASVFFEVAPDAVLYCVPHKTSMDENKVFHYTPYDDMMPMLKELGITVMFTSISYSGTGSNERERAELFEKENDWFTEFWAAGNDGMAGYNGKMRLAATVGVGAYYINSGKVVPEPYSSESEYVDFSAPTNVHYKPAGCVNSSPGTGTSAATPYLCGMAALVQDFFIDKTGRPLKRDALIQFFKDNCVDLNEPGHDNKTGYGAVVLPDPDTIDVWAYQEGGPEEMKVEDFKDADQISEWAKDSIQKCLDEGIMEGVGNELFNPKGPFTREQAAVLAVRILEAKA